MTRGCERRKWTPSTAWSTLTTASGRARTTAASSPTQRRTRGLRRRPGRSSSSKAAMSESSPTGRSWWRLPVAVDDAGAGQVVRRQLAPHAVAREDADPEAAHLAGDVPQHLVVVVELHAEHRVGQGLDDLALELDLLFLGHCLQGTAPGAGPGGRSAGGRPARGVAATGAAGPVAAAGGGCGLRRGL